MSDLDNYTKLLSEQAGNTVPYLHSLHWALSKLVGLIQGLTFTDFTNSDTVIAATAYYASQIHRALNPIKGSFNAHAVQAMLYDFQFTENTSTFHLHQAFSNYQEYASKLLTECDKLLTEKVY